MTNSWSGLRKELEQDFLCNALKGRVQYFITHYRDAHDDYGRICIRVDGKEQLMGNPYAYGVKGYCALEMQLKREQEIPMREWSPKETLYAEENQAVEDKVKALTIENGDFAIYDITDAIRTYKTATIADSLSSENPLVRMFAVLDRRVGKRTLLKLATQIEEQPQWLQFFYMLRLDAETIPYQLQSKNTKIES